MNPYGLFGFIRRPANSPSIEFELNCDWIEHTMQNDSMRGSLLTGVSHLEMQDLVVPEPGPDEVRIQLRRAGICGSDLHIYAGHYPGIPHPLTTGHEGLGTIDKCGANVSPTRLGE